MFEPPPTACNYPEPRRNDALCGESISTDAYLSNVERLAGIGVWVAEPETGRVFLNAQARRLLQIDADAVWSFEQLIDRHPVDAQGQVRAALADSLATGEPFD